MSFRQSHTSHILRHILARYNNLYIYFARYDNISFLIHQSLGLNLFRHSSVMPSLNLNLQCCLSLSFGSIFLSENRCSLKRFDHNIRVCLFRLLSLVYGDSGWCFRKYTGNGIRGILQLTSSCLPSSLHTQKKVKTV
jgi:hypothetical protein